MNRLFPSFCHAEVVSENIQIFLETIGIEFLNRIAHRPVNLFSLLAQKPFVSCLLNQWMFEFVAGFGQKAKLLYQTESLQDFQALKQTRLIPAEFKQQRAIKFSSNDRGGFQNALAVSINAIKTTTDQWLDCIRQSKTFEVRRKDRSAVFHFYQIFFAQVLTDLFNKEGIAAGAFHNKIDKLWRNVISLQCRLHDHFRRTTIKRFQINSGVVRGWTERTFRPARNDKQNWVIRNHLLLLLKNIFRSFVCCMPVFQQQHNRTISPAEHECAKRFSDRRLQFFACKVFWKRIRGRWDSKQIKVDRQKIHQRLIQLLDLFDCHLLRISFFA